MSTQVSLTDELEVRNQRDVLQAKLQEAIRRSAPQREVQELQRKIRELTEQLDAVSPMLKRASHSEE